ncbi:hypothetical protein [Magnetospirillum molischianum]|uniref:Membrane protein n=1 Tax=Magnetospirillum molischianum DSM 120 TaxID=1150626 RepID=H8FVV9_MAGML|nr:hypothetical protein [Magnetospirillum molischianum]CCG42497.1 Membrane protein [Magnetospirillum molischianum DSM 120]
MKARSVVFTHVQWPFTVFGLPPRLMVLAISPAALVYGLTILLGGVALSMIAFAVVLAVGLAFAYRLARRDRHVDSVALASAGFWGVSPRRWLLAGASPAARSWGTSV